MKAENVKDLDVDVLESISKEYRKNQHDMQK